MKYLLLLIIIVFPVFLYAQDKFDVNEDEIFSNPDMVVQEKRPASSDMENFINKKSVGISGEILSVFPFSISRDYVMDNDSSGNTFDPYVFGNIDFDARLPGSYKGFANIDVEYHPDESGTEAFLKELFVDFNISKKIYFRAGKQVLKWGRCYLWNPTDVINIQKTSFLEQIESREGTYGLKITIPFGTSVNMYGFADMYEAERTSDVGSAYKIEFLIGNTEMAFSVWGKKHYYPVYGYDFSTRVFGWDIVGEASCSQGNNYKKVRVVEDFPLDKLETYQEKDKWTTKASVNFGREFDGRDIPNRYSVKFEFFYNGAGYSENIFNDTNNYVYDKPVTIEDAEGHSMILPAGSKMYYLMSNELYEPNYLSRYYAAIFTNVKRIFVEDLTFNLNGIMNITDSSYILSAGFSYQNINDFKAGITVNAYLGKEDTEYTILRNAGNILVTAGIIF
ncbi:MAG: hypothetical protein JXN64_06525 [Spirochaetes bacterium]|nr:hypothetical protein [Spirochaetota bacterium]